MIFPHDSAALSLAVLVLPEPCAGTDARLDERDLSALGCRARRRDRHAGLLVSSVVVAKLMLDRMVWADGGNPDPTSTRGKEAGRAKALDLARWTYPRHLRGRVFSVIVRGDAAGAEALRRNLH